MGWAMAEMIGADPHQLAALSTRLTTFADQVEWVARDVGAVLAATPWHGYDADGFRSDWQSRLHGMVVAAAESARGCAAVVRRNADEQIAASQSDSAMALGAPGGGGRQSSDVGMIDQFSEWWKAVDSLDAANDIGKLLKLDTDLKWGVVAEAGDRLMKVFGKAIPVVGVTLGMIDLFQTVNNPASSTADIWNSAIQAGIGAIALFPPASLAMFGASLAFSVATAINPTIVEDTGRLIGDAAAAVGDGVADLAEDVGDAVDAAGAFISGGVNELAKRWPF